MSAAVEKGGANVAAADLANLDALRALAVSLVLLDHVLETISSLHPLLQFHPYDWGMGRLGVLLFFVHTSLVLNFSMVRLRATGWELLKSFYIRRAFRLYPLSILCVLLVAAAHIPGMPWLQYIWKGWGNLAANLTLTMNLALTRPVLGPLWSLPIEAQMYLVLPLIFMLLKPRRNVAFAAGLWLLAALAAALQPGFSDRLNVIGFAPYFMAGVLAFTLTGRARPVLPALLWVPFLLGLAGLYLTVQKYCGGIYSRPLQWGFCLLVGALLPCFRDSRLAVLNLASHIVAKYSYGVYLFHCVALWAAMFALRGLIEPVRWLLAVVILVAAAVASYHWIEHPAIRLGSRVASRLGSSSAPAAPAPAT
jgi:peptidoglycan/LPS O-acetylase OafA/YrhL